jgi:ketosteroid isomerase-like protein
MHPNAELVHDYMGAWERGDIDAVREYYTDDLVFHFPGRSALAGDYHGREGFFDDFGGKVAALGARQEVLGVDDVLASDDRAMAIVRERYERNGKEPLELSRVGIYLIRDGKIAELWVRDDDQYAVDAFFS